MDWKDDDEIWEENFLKYKKCKGKVEPSKSGLYAWIMNQRSKYKIGKLAKKHIKKLESLDYWEWIVELWDEPFNDFKKYAENGGNLLAKANEPFGTWMRTQRYNFRDKKLSKERIKRLDSHFTSAQNDLNEVLITTKKISNKKEKMLLNETKD